MPVYDLILEEIADELGDQAQKYLTPECRKGLINRFRRDLTEEGGQYNIPALLCEQDRREILAILFAAEEGINMELSGATRESVQQLLS